MKKTISTAEAPSPINNLYSQGILSEGKMVFTAGQVGLDPNTGKLVEGLEAQTWQALENVKAIVEAAGTNMSNVLKVTVLLDNIDDFGAMNAAYTTFFPANPPARTAYEVGRLPIGALVEIEAIAVID